MPDVATAPTATAAQTAAAGSRMIGFYLGAGNVKVDCKFDTANFLTRADTGQYTANGWLVTGSANATTGLVSVGMSYSGEMLGTIGSLRGSGTVGIGFGVKPSPTISGGWVSSLSTGGAWARGALSLSGTQLSIGFAASQTTAAGTDVAITNALTVQASGILPGGNNTQTLGASGSRWSEVWATKMLTPSGVILSLAVTGGGQWNISASTGSFFPSSDNAHPIGSASNRITTLFATNGTINTSDERFKIWIGRPGEDRAAKDRRIARAILDELGWYQFTDAVTEKGPDGARWHYGARAQRIWQIVADEGLAPPLVEVEGVLLPDISWAGPVAPAWLCFDGWNDQFEDVYREVMHVDEVQVGEEATGEFDTDGAEIMRPVTEEVERIEREPTGERQLVRSAGHLFGFRVDEMNLLLSWALHDRLSALEAAA
ncbi:hypothetical protein [Sphingopyxis sp. SCN 67-31]|uniref:tail fiber domain-containing protein n=1 Tax=Sphingopyxis sp. SCN 67-31 TaxID=1660142 RepID=UPI000B2238B4|nr:hypothetical protein [Sphingopyxis sp. SCN 67-31]